MTSQLSEAQRARVQQRLAAGLADLLGEGQSGIAGRAQGDRSPASYAQRRLWFLNRLQPDSPAYLVPAVLRLTGSLDEQALAKALTNLVARHEALRTRFEEVDGELWQVVAAKADLVAEPLDLSGLAPEARAAGWDHLVSVENQPSFDLSTGPLVRARLVRWSEHESRLLLTMHHIIVDGWSLGLLVEDLTTLYGAAPAPPSRASYRDYSLWQLDRVRAGELDGQLDYWADRLANLQPTELPGDRPRPQTMGWRGSRLQIELDPATTRAVDRMAADAGSTRFAVLAAAFSALLHRYRGDDDIVFGTPVAGRTTAESEPVVGMITNTVVLRNDVSGDPDFSRLVARTHETALEAYARQEVPFELVVERVAPERDPSRQPLFQIAFALQNLPALGTRSVRGLSIELMEMVGEAAKFDLSVLVTEAGAGLTCEFEFSTDLFDAATIERLASHYRAGLVAMLAEPARPISQIPLLTATERRVLLDDWAGGDRDFGPALVPELIERQIAANPAAIAVRDSSGPLSYGDFGARSARVAARLAELGCAAEDLVVVCADRSAELVTAAYGVLRAGAGYVPLDPSHPPERLAGLIAASGAKAVLVDETSLGRFGAIGVPVLSISALAREDFVGVASAVIGPRQRAYVVYTSGSTGVPKGVSVEHDGLANLVHWHLRQYQLDRQDQCTLVASPGFDASAWEIWTALAAGATLHVPNQLERTDPVVLARWLEDRGITTAFLPTALAEAVLTARPGGWQRLRYLLVGGDALSRDVVRPGATTVVNHYGPTENTVVATAGVVDPLDSDRARPTIGKAIDNVRCYVLDRGGEPVPIGVPGELYLGGRSLARGYLDDPERTAAQFVPDPFGPADSRLYRTGDLVRWLPTGELDFLGRVDRQVKIRGHRVEPGEVEDAVRAHPAVREAVVLVRGTDPVRRDLVAVVVLEERMDVSGDELRATVRKRLPGHMVPNRFVAVDNIPVNVSGKVDRTAVRWRAGRVLARRDSVTRPGNATEAAIVAIWQDLLELEQIDRQDNFFDLGGHSFLAVRLQQALADHFGAEVPIVDIFQFPTPAALAARLAQNEAAQNDAAENEPKPVQQEAARYADRRRTGRELQQARRRRTQAIPTKEEA